MTYTFRIWVISFAWGSGVTAETACRPHFLTSISKSTRTWTNINRSVQRSVSGSEPKNSSFFLSALPSNISFYCHVSKQDVKELDIYTPIIRLFIMYSHSIDIIYSRTTAFSYAYGSPLSTGVANIEQWAADHNIETDCSCSCKRKPQNACSCISSITQ